MISVNPLTTQKFGRIITASQINPMHGDVSKLLSCTGRIWICLSPGYITKHDKLGGLINRHLFLTHLEAGNGKSRWQQIGFLMWAFFLVPRHLSSNCVLTCLGKRERALSFFLKITLDIYGFVISYEFQDCLSVSVRNAIEILTGIALNLQICFD